MSIHATALISAQAHLGANVTVGPGAIIEAGCIIGENCEIRAHAVITGTSHIGARNQIGYGAIIGAEPQDLSFRPEVQSRVVIGNDNMIREYVTIHRGTKEGTQTLVGNHNFLMTGCHVAHNCRLGDHVILVNNVLLAGYVEVQDRAFLGGGAAVHQFVRVGAYAIMRGQTRIGKDLPPYFMATDTNQVAGLNRVGLRRNGFSAEARRQLQEAFDLLYFSGLNVSQRWKKSPGLCPDRRPRSWLISSAAPSGGFVWRNAATRKNPKGSAIFERVSFPNGCIAGERIEVNDEGARTL